MRCCCERPGEIVSREELQKKLWPADTFVDFEQGLNNAMKRLRAALDDNAESPRFIETVPRRGYRFIGAVNSNGQALAADAGTPALQVKPGRRSALSLLAASIAVVALALWWMSRIESPAPKNHQRRTADQRRPGEMWVDRNRWRACLLFRALRRWLPGYGSVGLGWTIGPH